MSGSSRRLIDDFLGSVQIFASTMEDLLEAELRDIAGTGLAFSQLKVLHLVASTAGHSISDLAAFLGVSTAAASKAVDRLVKRGLLLREEAPTDRRAVTLSLAPAGQALLAAYEQRSRRLLTEVFADFAPERLRDTAQVLDRLSLGVVTDHLEDDSGLCFRCGIYFRDRCLLRQSGRTCFYHQHRRAAQDTSLPHGRGPDPT